MKVSTAFVLSAIVLISSGTLTAGPLEPSAAPAPTMKTLSEVEPRIAINADNTPGDANYKYIISNSGSYYLTGNCLCSGKGIDVRASDVTIDLMGYSMTGENPGTWDYGISINGANKNITIRNGTIRGFTSGIYNNTVGSYGHCIENVRVLSNVQHGIHLGGGGCCVRNCIINDNGHQSSNYMYGIRISSKATVVDNIVSSNGTQATNAVTAISVGAGSTVAGNTVFDNGSDVTTTSNVIGISSGESCTVTGNTVYNNAYRCGGTAYGISAGQGSTVSGNTCRDNGKEGAGYVYGISASAYSNVNDNTIFQNGTSATGAVRGINTSSGSIIARNAVCNNGGSAAGEVRGISSGSGSTIIDNTAFNNGTTGVDVYGIYVSTSSLVDRNAVSNNGIGASGVVKNMDLTVSGCVYGNNVAP